MFFYSQEAHKRSTLAVTKDVEREKIIAYKELKKLQKRKFEHQEDALKAFIHAQKGLRYHLLSEPHITTTKHYKIPGRPLPGAAYEIAYHISGSVVLNENNFNKAVDQGSCFVLTTNIASESLSSAEVLDAYKKRDSTKKRFAFLKKPAFFTSSLNLEKPGRIEAILMIMVLSLLVYSLAQRRLRKIS